METDPFKAFQQTQVTKWTHEQLEAISLPSVDQDMLRFPVL